MNDQQSSPVPDPHGHVSSTDDSSSPSEAVLPSHDGDADGLSDQEAFLMLALSMSEDGPGPEPGIEPPSAADHGWAVGLDCGPVEKPSSEAYFEKSVAADREPAIDLRAQSPFLTAMAGKLRGRRNGKSWAMPTGGSDAWEVHHTVDPYDGIVHGRVTEVVDLSTVPVPPADVEIDDAKLDAVPPPLTPSSEVGNLLPSAESSEGENDLPPLVFLDTQGDIMPSVRFSQPTESLPPRVVVEWDEDGIVTKAEPTVSDPDTAMSNGDAGTAALPEAAVEIDEEPFGADVSSLAESTDTTCQVINVPMRIWENPDTNLVLDEAGRMFDQYCGPVIAVIASVAKDRRAIDEAVHETFLTAWESMDSFDPDEPRGPWMFTLARRTAFEQVAVSRDLGLGPDGCPAPTHREVEVSVDQSWEAWEVRLAVDQLSSTEYDVLRLTHREGLIHPEIASEMNNTVGAVKSRAYSGSHRLVELLDHVIRPDADGELDQDQASALTWYLAGVADGSDLDEDERSAVKRVRNQLSSSTAWILPDTDARDRLVQVVHHAIQSSASAPSAASFAGDGEPPTTSAAGALADPDELELALPATAPLGSIDANVDSLATADTTVASAKSAEREQPARLEQPAQLVQSVQPAPLVPEAAKASDPEPTGEHSSVPAAVNDGRPPVASIAVGLGLVLVAAMVMTNLFGLLDSGDVSTRTYQLQPTEIDADATAVVELAPSDTGTRFEFEFGGLDPSSAGGYYAVWLQGTANGSVAPLGSFNWDVSGPVVTLSGPAGYDYFDLLVVTKGSRDGQASINDPVVLAAAID